jgi:hypothetical protein
MSSIDDPIEAVRSQYPEEQFDPLGIALGVLTPAHPLAKVGSAIKKFFSQKEARARVEALFWGFEWFIRNHDKRIEDIEAKLESPAFLETIVIAVNKAVQSASFRKVKRFATILGYEAVYCGAEESLEDAAAFIRTLEELEERDIEALRLLHRHQTQLFDNGSYRNYNAFNDSYKIIANQIEPSGFTKEEFYARCSRLGGYGLVLTIEIRANVTPLPQGTHTFRITTLGDKLANILLSAKDDEVIPQ